MDRIRKMFDRPILPSMILHGLKILIPAYVFPIFNPHYISAHIAKRNTRSKASIAYSINSLTISVRLYFVS